MGDTWIKTIVRIVTPNMTSTILEVFSYYFVNAMVNAVYEGETTDEANSSANPKTFPEPLTLDLLEKHQELSESCKIKRDNKYR